MRDAKLEKRRALTLTGTALLTTYELAKQLLQEQASFIERF
jgi:hypothetical protein